MRRSESGLTSRMYRANICPYKKRKSSGKTIMDEVENPRTGGGKRSFDRGVVVDEATAEQETPHVKRVAAKKGKAKQ